MTDAVVRVQAHLRELARDNWEALEDRHGRDLAWLRAELEQVARALDVRGVRVDVKRPARAPFVSDYGPPRALKKRKLSVAPRASVNEPRVAADVAAESAAVRNGTGDHGLPSESIDLTRDEPAEETAAGAGAVRVRASTSKGEQHEASRKQAGGDHEHDKKRSRKRGRPRESQADPLRMRVIDLRAELRNRGLRSTGNKPELLSRLLNAMAAGAEQARSSNEADHRTFETDEGEQGEAHESHAEETSDADAGRSDGYAAGASASNRESDSDANHVEEARDVVSHEVETSVSAALAEVVQNTVELATEAEKEAGGRRSRFIGFSTAIRGVQADLTTRATSSKAEGDAEKRSTSLESSLKVTPAVSASDLQDPPEQSVTDLYLDPETNAEDGADASSPLTIRSTAEADTVASLQGETNHTTPRDEIVPSSYTSHVDAVETSRRDVAQHHKDEINEESTALLTEVTQSEVAVAVAAPQPVVQTSVSWLHSRAKEAIKAFTERRTDASVSSTSLLARGFRALQDAIVPDSMTDTSQATSEQVSQSASKVPSSRAKSPADPDSTPRPSLRTTTSLPMVDRQPSLKVTFAHNDAVDTIVEEPRTDDSARGDAEASSAAGFAHANEAESFADGRARSASLPKAELPREGVRALAKTPDSLQSASASSHDVAGKAKSAEADKSDEARRRREFQESVDREAQRLRKAAMLSAQKRLEEAKATKAFWEKREQLKLQLQASDASVRVPTYEASTAAAAVEVAPASAESSSSKQADAPGTTPSLPATASVEAGASAKPRAGAATAASRTASASTRPRADSMLSTVSSASSSSGSAKGLAPGSTAGSKPTRGPSNLVSGVHSFLTVMDSNKDAASSASTRSAPVVNSLKLAEKTRQLEEKKKEEKARRKEALMRKYEEQRRLDEKKKEEDKRKREAQEKAERELKLKREQERVEAKKKRELELAHKRQERLQEMKRRAAKLAAEKEKEKEKALAMASMAMKVAAAAASSSSHATSAAQLVPPPRPTKPRPVKVDHPGASNAKQDAPPRNGLPASSSAAAAAPQAPSASTSKQPAAAKKPVEPAASYDMSDQGDSDSEDGASADDDDEAARKRRRRGGKDIPAWAQRENLEKALRAQFGPNAADPSPSIFPDFADTCDLEAIFDSSDARRKKRFGRRTSSGNWFGDRPTARDRAQYRRDMGFNR